MLTLWAYAGYARHARRPHPNPLPAGEGSSGPHPNPLPKDEGTGGPHPDPLPKGEGTDGPHPNPLPKGEGIWWRYALVLVFFCLGLMAKPMLVTLPFVLLLLDYWPLGRWRRGGAGWLIVEKLPLLALAAASCAVTLWAQTEALEKLEVHSMDYRAANALVSYGRYLLATLWPANLAVYYPPPLRLAGAAGRGRRPALVAISGIAIWQGAVFPTSSAAGSGIWECSIPVIGLVQVGGQAIAATRICRRSGSCWPWPGGPTGCGDGPAWVLGWPARQRRGGPGLVLIPRGK